MSSKKEVFDETGCYKEAVPVEIRDNYFEYLKDYSKGMILDEFNEIVMFLIEFGNVDNNFLTRLVEFQSNEVEIWDSEMKEDYEELVLSRIKKLRKELVVCNKGIGTLKNGRNCVGSNWLSELKKRGEVNE